MGFARLTIIGTNAYRRPLVVNAGNDVHIGEAGSAWLHGSISGHMVTWTNWSKLSGPGNVTFTNVKGSPLLNAIVVINNSP